MSMLRQLLGKSGEEMAATELKRKGYTIHARNWRCQYGEIDIIAEKDNCIAIVEVKTRSSEKFGPPTSAVNRRKQGKITRATECWLQENHLDADIRFDVIAIVQQRGCKPLLEHFENAFDCTGFGW
ncbi:YraN family protein [Desulforhopalus vacuolatus]|uniref:YraN family protein n=1 Tax=Desulforhopalus vacuolatus TaxID=40414 RepID=UPI001963E977|nr:YraN family protein [Desulforhopalus vacuolatus]MBM9519804.1 YraN family protein [Desulforhopalus vacuolatus]